MKRKLLILLALCLIASITLSACFKEEEELQVKLEPRDFDISNYIEYEENGHNGYGYLSINVDYKKLMSDLYPYIQKSIKNKSDLPEYLIDFMEMYPPFEFSYDNDNHHSNNDIITVNIEKTENAKEIESYIDAYLISNNTEYKFKSLKDVQEYNPFEDLISNVSGKNGEGKASFKIEHKTQNLTWSCDVKSDVKLEKLSNGQKINLSIDEGLIDDEKLARDFGLKIIKKKFKYTISELIGPPIPDNIFKCIDKDTIKTVNSVAKDWIVDGLNDENQGDHERNVELVGEIFFTNDKKSKLFFIYHVTDDFVENGYYVYLSPQKELLANPQKKELLTIDNEKLTDSFIYYDKETIRYTEKFKWGQNYEQHGFMYKNIPYAGKLTLNEEINYLSSIYPEYTKKYYSKEIKDLIIQTKVKESELLNDD